VTSRNLRPGGNKAQREEIRTRIKRRRVSKFRAQKQSENLNPSNPARANQINIKTCSKLEGGAGRGEKETEGGSGKPQTCRPEGSEVAASRRRRRDQCEEKVVSGEFMAKGMAR